MNIKQQILQYVQKLKDEGHSEEKAWEKCKEKFEQTLQDEYEANKRITTGQLIDKGEEDE